VTERIKAPRGTFDVLPDDAVARAELADAVGALFHRAGYGRIETPAFEDTALFARTVGEATDIVSKEMFTFDDRGGRSITLRPEGTAPICRAYVEHGMHKLAQPVKLWYLGPYFRYEAPQAGRFRQFNQIGAEAIGSDLPLVDAELIGLLNDLLTALEVPKLDLRLGSLGSPESRVEYRSELQAYLRANEGDLSKEVLERIETNPLRAFDSADPSTRSVMEGAPTMLERLDAEDAAHFEEVRALLDQAGIAYRLDPTLVRGLDYYTRTIFEFHSDQLGAQSQLGGGGRYDRLVAELGGPETPAVGWAAGVERILLAAGRKAQAPSVDAFVAIADPGQGRRAAALVNELRRAGLAVEMDLAGRSMKGQLKQADRIGARAAIILDADGTAQLRDMRTGEQTEVDPADAAGLIDPGAGK
jgi:histidyl-tRNA synthetase